MKYTIRDISRLSGVSIKTVSRVINNEPNVKPATRDKVLKVIADTRYKPNLYAQNLNTKTHKTLLISVRKNRDQNTTKWLDILFSYLTSVSAQNRYTILHEVIYDDNDLKNSILETSSGYVDAVVLLYIEENDKRVQLALDNQIPFVSVEKHEQAAFSVSNNNRKGMLDAADYLFGRGLTRICLLLGADMAVNRERANAMVEAYRIHGISPDLLEVVYHMNEFEKIKRFVDWKIEQNLLPEVFFVSGDEKVVAVYHSIYSHGLTIPGDVSVIGFDNIPISNYYYPPLTTVGQDFEELARQIVQTVDKIIDGDTDLVSVEVDPQLVIRQSVK
ncbi:MULTISPECIES: LacI family DNA-binding transcriptional regulator [Saccharibacillus]|uniref:LacI family DNA-binding transcriptional regulator n=1 Tax=Saccharibacillus TaxID=456492 RepID=UPI00123BC671|nr:LacI family DNA-binding transcriptional regulator [Saccharibacillus sp. WB 17]MWJ32392.1 LacI family DNA-binding transcriptional regulator [Saccharibacillus sp. WB 17]